MAGDNNDLIQGEVLPIPDRKPISLTTYQSTDPDTKFPPIAPDKPFFIYFAPGAKTGWRSQWRFSEWDTKSKRASWAEVLTKEREDDFAT
jgi:hypothetical protein